MTNVIPFTRPLKRCEALFNPMSIIKEETPWEGEIIPGVDDKFCQFKNFSYGLRAAGIILLVYHLKHDLDTVRTIINRWAPPVENDTSSYQIDVAERMGVTPDTKLDLTDINVMLSLCKAIVHHEQGRVLPTDKDFYDGAYMALHGKIANV